ncbi:MAG: 4Fe-4S dicluster domain-containing protein [Firmicutes bacterium]|nr:4Fe-4S dicluster domain-containing protein [Bacillota bacterium]
MGLNLSQQPQFIVERDPERCIGCRVCENQCANLVHTWDEELQVMAANDELCVGCHRCVELCPTRALNIGLTPLRFRPNAQWTDRTIKEIYQQAESGQVLLTGMGNDRDYRIYWDHLLLNACQVTNPSIDPLREPMETKTFIGSKPDALTFKDGRLETKLPPQLELEVPVLFAAMSLGAISLNVHKGMTRAAESEGSMYNTGEGGLHKDLRKYGKNTIVQVASGRFAVDIDYLEAGAAIEIKIGQGAKPGIGGHLPGSKVTQLISETRMIPTGSDALSPYPHHDIYSIEDLKQLIYTLKEATRYRKPVGVKISAVHNVAAIASGIARAGADFITIDGFRGGTGAAPLRIRDNVGIPIELALASADNRLRDEGIRNRVSIIAAGSIRNSADVVKAIALGADAVYIGTAALVAVGCHLCQKCHTGKCNWGIATQDPWLVKRVNPEVAYRRLSNLLRAWKHEIKEMMGGMGINSLDSLRSNRLMLRGINLDAKEREILGVLAPGE